MRDPIVEEVRRARAAYAAQFNHDLDRIVDDLKRSAEEKHLILKQLHHFLQFF